MTRKYTNLMLNMLDEGQLDPEQLAEHLLMWMSEDDVKEFCEKNGYGEDDE